ncbi:MAG: hypothetical protein ACREB3_10105, partial [Burkholderiales bacterium]
DERLQQSTEIAQCRRHPAVELVAGATAVLAPALRAASAMLSSPAVCLANRVDNRGNTARCRMRESSRTSSRFGEESTVSAPDEPVRQRIIDLIHWLEDPCTIDRRTSGVVAARTRPGSGVCCGSADHTRRAVAGFATWCGIS